MGGRQSSRSRSLLRFRAAIHHLCGRRAIAYFSSIRLEISPAFTSTSVKHTSKDRRLRTTPTLDHATILGMAIVLFPALHSISGYRYMDSRSSSRCKCARMRKPPLRYLARCVISFDREYKTERTGEHKSVRVLATSAQYSVLVIKDAFLDER